MCIYTGLRSVRRVHLGSRGFHIALVVVAAFIQFRAGSLLA